MDNMVKEYKNILNNLEEKLKDNPDLEYIKSEFTNLFMIFFNEVDTLRVFYEEKLETILDRQSYFDEKMNNLEEKTNELEKGMLYDEDDEMIRNLFEDTSDMNEYDEQECEVSCPYCNEIFYIDMEEARKEINCPYCNKAIELDWNDTSNDEDDM